MNISYNNKSWTVGSNGVVIINNVRISPRQPSLIQSEIPLSSSYVTKHIHQEVGIHTARIVFLLTNDQLTELRADIKELLENLTKTTLTVSSVGGTQTIENCVLTQVTFSQLSAGAFCTEPNTPLNLLQADFVWQEC